MNGLFHIETLLEAINASAAVNQLLLAGKEGVALGANFDLQLGLSNVSPHTQRTVDLPYLGWIFSFTHFHLFCACCGFCLNRKMNYSIVMFVWQDFFAMYYGLGGAAF